MSLRISGDYGVTRPGGNVSPRVQFTVRSHEGTAYMIDLKAGNPITICEIYLAGGALVGYGLGVRKHGDRYNREYGYRMAYKSAIGLWIARYDRDLFWEKYLMLFPVEDREEPVPESARCDGDEVVALIAAIQNLRIAVHQTRARQSLARVVQALQALG